MARIREFLTRREPRHERCELNEVITAALDLMRRDCQRRGITLALTLMPGTPAVQADAVLIEQVVINLVRNAMDAMRNTPPADRVVEVSTALDGRFALVTVADRGTGIPAEIAARLFEPFFTTKHEGMGMGLNICRSIAELHHGRLGFEVRPGGGTIFTLSLPLDDPTA